jgi:serine/threonine-protein kinase
MPLTLIVTDGPHAGRSFTFTEHETFLVGRSSNAHFALTKKDKFISRLHFLMEVNPPLCRLMDLGSHNHTFVNGKEVQACYLKDGDVIRAGRTILRVDWEEKGTVDDAPGPAPHLAGLDLAAAACTDQHERWAQGRRIPAEAYINAWTALQADAEAVVDLIYGEFVLRDERGEKPDPAEYYRRFPQYANALARQFQLHAALEDAARDSDSAPPGVEPPGYTLHSALGRGRLGVVYRAENAEGVPAAIKVIRPKTPLSPEALERFLSDARCLLDVRHTGLCPMLDVGASGGYLYFVSELIPGRDAAALTTDMGPLAISRVVGWVCQSLDALADVHARGLFHGDVKPSNLIVTEHAGWEQVTLLDFGQARLYHASSLSGLSMTDARNVSAMFQAPEQLRNFREAGPPADQYAAAATLYYLLTARHVHDGATSYQEMLHRTFGQQPTPIRRLRPGVPEPLAEAVHRALARDPHQRFTDVRELHAALAPFASSVYS